MVVVVLHHISDRMGSGLMEIFRNVGCLAVGVFFCVSGYGLIKSINSKSDYLGNFIYKKLIRIYIPYMGINALTVLMLNYTTTNNYTVTEIIRYCLSMSLIDSTLWFVVTIIIFYFFFYISFVKIRDIKSILNVVVLISLYVVICRYLEYGSWTYISSFCFPLGLIIGYYEIYINSFLYERYLVMMLLSALILFLAIYLKASAYVISVLFSCAVFLFFGKFTPQSYIFNLLGIISLEIYLLHMKLLLLFEYFTFIDSGLWILLYLSVLISISYLLHKTNMFFYNKIVFNNI